MEAKKAIQRYAGNLGLDAKSGGAERAVVMGVLPTFACLCCPLPPMNNTYVYSNSFWDLQGELFCLLP